MARTFTRLLASGGADVAAEIALTVGDALARLARPPRVDGILLGLLLPDAPGERVLDAIEAADSPYPPRVLVITGIEDPPRLVALLLRGYPLLPKPMTGPALRDAAR